MSQAELFDPEEFEPRLFEVAAVTRMAKQQNHTKTSDLTEKRTS